MKPNDQSSPDETAPLDPLLTDSLDLTIAVPCKNEEKNILGTLDTIVSAVNEVGCSYEIIVIDDGSTDKTSELVEQFGVGIHRCRSVCTRIRETLVSPKPT